MRIPRSRGAVSGLLLMILGAWGALVPFIGPYFGLVIGPDDAWNWSTDRLWLSVLPGVVAFAGGLILVYSAHRGGAGLGAWMGIAAGAWFALGPLVSRLWTTDGASALGVPAGDTNRQVLELLVMYEALGVLTAAIAAFALGRLAVRSVRDVELAEATAVEEREPAPMATRPIDRDRDRDGVPDEDDRFRRTPEPATRPLATASAPTSPMAGRPATATASPADSTDETTRIVPPVRPTAEPTASTSPTAPVTPATETETRRSGGLLSRLRRG